MTLTLALLFAAVAFAPRAASAVEIRLVAADREQQPAVDRLVDFRRHPDGGLIAVQWASGLRLGELPVFALADPDAAVAGGPKLPTEADKPGEDVLDLLDDIRGKPAAAPEPPRPVDQVDPLYATAELSDGLKIGPRRVRRSAQQAVLDKPALLTPGGIRVDSSAAQVRVPCYPVTITAVAADAPHAAISFQPRLTYAGRDLLADALFEYSPDLVTGDYAGGVIPTSLVERLAATRGGRRDFRRLTLYLPANPAGQDPTPYKLGATEFRVAPTGVELAPASPTPPTNAAPVVRATGKFSLQIVQPTAAVPTGPTVSILAELAEGWTHAGGDQLAFVSASATAQVELRSPENQRVTLLTRLPYGSENLPHRYLLLTAGNRPQAVALALPAAAESKGKLTLSLAASTPAGLTTLPKQLTATLRPWLAQRPAVASAEQPLVADTVTELELNFLARDQWSAPVDQLTPGLYALRLATPDGALPVVPVVISGRKTAGSVALGTYHNRSDYRRGETLHLLVATRALAAVENVPARLTLRHADGERLSLGELQLSAPAGESRSQFVAVPTADLRLGEYVAEIETDNLLSFAQRVTIYPETPRTTFALYSWMPASFSAPVRAAGETIVNLLLADAPSKALSPAELPRFAGQDSLPIAAQRGLAVDPLYPPIEATHRYDPVTELEMAIALRLGLNYAPSYSWGLNGQESTWNPKHTLPDELARVRRMASQVTQRVRDFGSYSGLFLNWYPTLGGYWEAHPATDGRAGDRRARLQAELAQLQSDALGNATLDATPANAEQAIELATRKKRYQVSAFARAYRDWVATADRLPAGMRDRREEGAELAPDERQPGITPGARAYPSFLPISWFHQMDYYPTAYFSTLPAATVHAYTDYGFSPFQPVWGVDYWAAGLAEKPVWITTMSNGRDIMLRQAMLAVGRGADGIDIKGQDDTTARVISQTLTQYGPFFRTLEPHSEVAIITSLRQQIVHGRLVGKWMGYTGGEYYALYNRLFYARRPPRMLPEEQVTPESLATLKAVFLVGQQEPLPASALAALKDFQAAGGKVYKDEKSSDDQPGERLQLSSLAKLVDGKPKWDIGRYKETRDQMFVGVLAGYEGVAAQLDDLFAALPAPRVTSDSHNLQLAEMRGRDVTVVMAANDTHPWPGIEHPWNFWSATIMAARGELSFDRPYVVYDLLAGGARLTPEPAGDRYRLPLSFERCAARSLVLLPEPLAELRLRTPRQSSGGELTVSVEIAGASGNVIRDPLPVELSLVNEHGRVVETIYRALGPGRSAQLVLPARAAAGVWRIAARELVSGLTAQAEVTKLATPHVAVEGSQVLVPRPSEIAQFFAAAHARNPVTTPAAPAASLKEPFNPLAPVKLADAPQPPVTEHPGLLILLDQTQLDAQGEELRKLADELAARLNASRQPAEVAVLNPLDLVEVPQRWQPNGRDRSYLDQAIAGRGVVVAAPLHSRYFPSDTAIGKPDWVHPLSGYDEPGARHRVYRHVVLLGDPRRQRLLADLHGDTNRPGVGMRMSPALPGPEAALAQVIWDGFVPGYNVLSIQSPDLAGLARGVDQILALRDYAANAPGKRAAVPADQLTVGRERRPPRNVLNEVFGAPVYPQAATGDGGLLVSAGTQGANYFLIDKAGEVTRSWTGKYGIHLSQSRQVMWLRNFYGVPGFVNTIIRADQSAEPQWLMELPDASGGYTGWQFPGERTLPDKVTDDLFVAAGPQLSRITPAGEVVWQYNDLTTCRTVDDVRHPRTLMLYGVSPDGQHLLAAAFGVKTYGRLVTDFVRPTVMLLSAKTGQVEWTRDDVLINHSACRLAGERILLADATPGRRQLLMLDLAGKEAWSLPLPAGASEAALTPDGESILLRPEVPRDKSQQVVGEATGLTVVRIADRSVTQLPIEEAIHDWLVTPGTGQVIVSTRDGKLTAWQPDGRQLWSRQFSGPVRLLAPGESDLLLAGALTGELLWLNGAGEVTRSLDLMKYNIVDDVDDYVRQYTAAPTHLPVREPRPTGLPTVDVRHGKSVKFSANLLDPTRSKQLTAGPLRQPATVTLSVEAGQLYALSIIQRSAGGARLAQPAQIEVAIREGTAAEPVYAAPLPISLSPEERTLAWRATKSGMATLTFSTAFTTAASAAKGAASDAKEPVDQGAPAVDLSRVAVMAVSYPSGNLLAQRVPDSPDAATGGPLGGSSIEDLLGGGSGKPVKPPKVRYFMPDDVNLANRSRGAPPFRQVIDFTLPFDGRLSGQKTSWLGKPLHGSSHARLELTFDEPVRLSAISVHEDPTHPAGYTDTYAVIVKEAETGRWQQAGYVRGNQSPWNLFTFPPVNASEIVYLWLSSPDHHARVAEMEAYRAAGALLP